MNNVKLQWFNCQIQPLQQRNWIKFQTFKQGNWIYFQQLQSILVDCLGGVKSRPIFISNIQCFLN